MPPGKSGTTFTAARLTWYREVVQRYIHPALWDPRIVTVLLWPAGLVFGIPGLLLLLLVRRPRRHRFFLTPVF